MNGQDAPAPPPPAAPPPAAPPRQAVYGRNFSYFSHRVFVVFTPEEMHRYLHERMEYVEPAGGAPGGAGEQIDMQLARWVLLQRSELNALSLNRVLETWLDHGDELRIPATLRSDSDLQYRMDITLQFAVELQLAAARDSPMLRKRPRLHMALLDSAYYVSRLRLERERRDDGSARRVDIDLSAAGREAFRYYLVQRMNLEEDRPTDSGVHLQPLTEEELNWLYGVAAGVAHTLSSSADSKELESRWRRDIGPQWQALQLPVLDEGFFNVLLLGEQSPLIEIPMSEIGGGSADELDRPVQSFRFRWRQTINEAPPWTRSVQDIVANSRWPVRRIRHVDAVLRHAMLLPEKSARGSADIQIHPLQQLADLYRMLPLTPSWSNLDKAIENMKLAAKGLGEMDSLHGEGLMLRRYAETLHRRETAQALFDAFGIAAALAGLRARVPDQRWPSLQDWADGLQAVSEGLRCKEIDLPEFAARVGQLKIDMVEQGGMAPVPPLQAPPAANSPDGVQLRRWPEHEWFAHRMGESFASGRAWAAQPSNASQVAARAWESVRARLAKMAGGGTQAASLASAAELICRARVIGPGPWLPLRLEEAGCRSWTRVLLRALKGGHELSLGWALSLRDGLIAHALERLGMRALNADLQNHLLAPLDVSAPAVRSYAESLGLWQGAGQFERVALVITAQQDSMAEQWPMPPREGLVFACAASQLEDLDALKIASWARGLAEPLRVAVEPQAGRGAEDKAIEKWLDRTLANVAYTRIWLTRPNQPAPGTPSLTQPSSADELWSVGLPTPPSSAS